MWSDLSDEELKTKLLNRMKNDPFAIPLIDGYVKFREEPAAIAWINQQLGEE